MCPKNSQVQGRRVVSRHGPAGNEGMAHSGRTIPTVWPHGLYSRRRCHPWPSTGTLLLLCIVT